MQLGVGLSLTIPRKPPSGGGGGGSPAQLVLNSAAKTGFTFFIRML